MSNTTRQQLLLTARSLFADRGFYGTSIAAISDRLGLTKQALLHHFSNKEKLYGEVLKELSGELLEESQRIMERESEPAAQLEELVLAQYRAQMADQDSARLIMRELLDNEHRAERAGNWYLKPYLELLVDTVSRLGVAGEGDRAHALALVYQLLGAAHYLAVSQPTLASIFGNTLFEESRACYDEELRLLIRARLQESRP